jgi:hypothetical protein
MRPGSEGNSGKVDIPSTPEGLQGGQPVVDCRSTIEAGTKMCSVP